MYPLFFITIMMIIMTMEEYFCLRFQLEYAFAHLMEACFFIVYEIDVGANEYHHHYHP